MALAVFNCEVPFEHDFISLAPPLSKEYGKSFMVWVVAETEICFSHD